MKLLKTVGLIFLWLLIPVLLIRGLEYIVATAIPSGGAPTSDALGAGLVTGIGTLIIITPFFYLISRTIKKYKLSKNTNISNPDEENSVEKMELPLDGMEASASAKIKQSKIKKKKRFCRYCGSELDIQTKKCPGCGKQYFHLPKIKKQSALIICGGALILILAGLNVYQYIDNKNESALLENQLSSVRQELSRTYDVLSSWRDEYNFHHDRAVLVQQESSDYYHYYGCSCLDYTKWITILDIFTAIKYLDLDPCPVCRAS